MNHQKLFSLLFLIFLSFSSLHAGGTDNWGWGYINPKLLSYFRNKPVWRTTFFPATSQQLKKHAEAPYRMDPTLWKDDREIFKKEMCAIVRQENKFHVLSEIIADIVQVLLEGAINNPDKSLFYKQVLQELYNTAKEFNFADEGRMILEDGDVLDLSPKSPERRFLSQAYEGIYLLGHILLKASANECTQENLEDMFLKFRVNFEEVLNVSPKDYQQNLAHIYTSALKDLCSINNIPHASLIQNFIKYVWDEESYNTYYQNFPPKNDGNFLSTSQLGASTLECEFIKNEVEEVNFPMPSELSLSSEEAKVLRYNLDNVSKDIVRIDTEKEDRMETGAYNHVSEEEDIFDDEEKVSQIIRGYLLTSDAKKFIDSFSALMNGKLQACTSREDREALSHNLLHQAQQLEHSVTDIKGRMETLDDQTRKVLHISTVSASLLKIFSALLKGEDHLNLETDCRDEVRSLSKEIVNQLPQQLNLNSDSINRLLDGSSENNTYENLTIGHLEGMPKKEEKSEGASLAQSLITFSAGKPEDGSSSGETSPAQNNDAPIIVQSTDLNTASQLLQSQPSIHELQASDLEALKNQEKLDINLVIENLKQHENVSDETLQKAILNFVELNYLQFIKGKASFQSFPEFLNYIRKNKLTSSNEIEKRFSTVLKGLELLFRVDTQIHNEYTPQWNVYSERVSPQAKKLIEDIKETLFENEKKRKNEIEKKRKKDSQVYTSLRKLKENKANHGLIKPGTIQNIKSRASIEFDRRWQEERKQKAAQEVLIRLDEASVFGVDDIKDGKIVPYVSNQGIVPKHSFSNNNLREDTDLNQSHQQHLDGTSSQASHKKFTFKLPRSLKNVLRRIENFIFG